MPETRRRLDLVGLLQLQRRRATERDGLVRGSAEWDAASEEMDALNRLIVRSAQGIPAGDDAVGMGVDLDLDSRPARDLIFRRHVVGSVRRAIAATASRLDLLARRTGGRMSTSQARIARAAELVSRVESDVRQSYPWVMIRSATLAPAGPDLDILSMVADRDGDGASVSSRTIQRQDPGRGTDYPPQE